MLQAWAWLSLATYWRFWKYLVNNYFSPIKQTFWSVPSRGGPWNYAWNGIWYGMVLRLGLSVSLLAGRIAELRQLSPGLVRSSPGVIIWWTNLFFFFCISDHFEGFLGFSPPLYIFSKKIIILIDVGYPPSLNVVWRI